MAKTNLDEVGNEWNRDEKNTESTKLSGFSEKVSIIDKPLANLTKRRGHKSTKLEIKNVLITDSTEIQIISVYYENLYSKRLDKPQEIEEFLNALSSVKIKPKR